MPRMVQGKRKDHPLVELRAADKTPLPGNKTLGSIVVGDMANIVLAMAVHGYPKAAV